MCRSSGWIPATFSAAICSCCSCIEHDSAVWHRVGVQFLRIILVDLLVLEDLVLLVCHHVIGKACAFLIKELTRALNQARLIEKMFHSTLIGRNYAGIQRICTLQHDSSIIFFQVLVALQAGSLIIWRQPHSIQWRWTDSKIWKGGGWRCLAPCMPPGQLVKFIAMLLSWHAGSHALLLLAWPTWIHQTGHVHWSVAGNLLEVGIRWKVDHSNMSLNQPSILNFPN